MISYKVLYKVCKKVVRTLSMREAPCKIDTRIFQQYVLFIFLMKTTKFADIAISEVLVFNLLFLLLFSFFLFVIFFS